MKWCYWSSIMALVVAGPVRAQSLAGTWQGVEAEAGDPRYWPALLRMQVGKAGSLFGILYQEAGEQPDITVTFQMQGTRTATGLQLTHVRKLNETRQSPARYWCDGAITFTYDASQEKLTGHATYRPVGDCDTGDFTLYRVKLKSVATVPANTQSTLRVSGRDVHWFADAELRQPVATGNSYRTKLSKTTTFYLTQGFYPTAQSSAVPITIQVTGAAKTPPSAPAASAAPPTAPAPADSVPAPAASLPPPSAPTPAVVLPTVLFKQGTPELLPESGPALSKLAADLRADPQLRLRVAGHTDRLGEAEKNQLLSEQRAEAVRAYLVKAGVAAARISTVGYGDTRPLYPSPDARNRRVEVEKLP